MTVHATKTAPAHLKVDQNTDSGSFTAVVSVFNNVDSVGDRVMPGAFADTLAAWDGRPGPIPVIWSHRWDDPEAHIGYVTAAAETDEGLEVTAQLDVEDNPVAKRVWKLLKGRRIDQFSFAYDVVDAAEADDGANELLSLDLIEVGPTLLGANRDTHLVSAKTTEQITARLEQLERAMSDGFAAVTSRIDEVAAAVAPPPDAHADDDTAAADADGSGEADGEERGSPRRRSLAELALAELDIGETDTAELDGGGDGGAEVPDAGAAA